MFNEDTVQTLLQNMFWKFVLLTLAPVKVLPIRLLSLGCIHLHLLVTLQAAIMHSIQYVAEQCSLSQQPCAGFSLALESGALVAVRPLSPFDIQLMLSKWNSALYHRRPTNSSALQAKHALNFFASFQLLERVLRTDCQHVHLHSLSCNRGTMQSSLIPRHMALQVLSAQVSFAPDFASDG